MATILWQTNAELLESALSTRRLTAEKPRPTYARAVKNGFTWPARSKTLTLGKTTQIPEIGYAESAVKSVRFIQTFLCS